MRRHHEQSIPKSEIVIGGVEQKAYFFALNLPQSDACYVRAYPFLCRELRRPYNAMICRPSGAITNFQPYLPARRGEHLCYATASVSRRVCTTAGRRSSWKLGSWQEPVGVRHLASGDSAGGQGVEVRGSGLANSIALELHIAGAAADSSIRAFLSVKQSAFTTAMSFGVMRNRTAGSSE